jgi:predicted HD phosphohydrolase
MPQEPVKEVLDLLTEHRDLIYPGERITILELSLRTAFLAEEAKSPSTEITAALLHNLGHLLQNESEGKTSDEMVRDYLRRWFGDPVIEPIQMQIPAKRYLCATEPSYVGQLSESSSKSLAQQGGPMSPSEMEGFLKSPYAEAAIRLRHLHDRAKVDGSSAPEPDHFVPHLDASTIEIDHLSPAQIV